jgi:hypothetical protein
MTQLSTNSPTQLGRIFPQYQLSPEEKAKRKAEQEAFYQRCPPIFERIRSELNENYYNWFIVIEPNSQEYFIDIDEMSVLQKVRQKYPVGTTMMFRLNETGTCGRI